MNRLRNCTGKPELIVPCDIYAPVGKLRVHPKKTEKRKEVVIHGVRARTKRNRDDDH